MGDNENPPTPPPDPPPEPEPSDDEPILFACTEDAAGNVPPAPPPPPPPPPAADAAVAGAPTATMFASAEKGVIRFIKNTGGTGNKKPKLKNVSKALLAICAERLYDAYKAAGHTTIDPDALAQALRDAYDNM